MSLQVWLPFNGSFENQGCGDYVITENSSSKVAYDDNGKIGKCKKAGQLKINKNPLGLNGTIAFWIWIDENYDRADGVVLFGNNNTGTGITNRKWSLFLHSNNYSLHSWGCMRDDGDTNGNGGFTVSDCFTAKKWHHVAVAHDEKNQYVYIDSELKKTTAWSSSGKFTFDVETILSYPHGGEGGIKMNDLRLYDHCLSLAEVQELAKGLVLHYTFDDPYCEDTTNLNSQCRIADTTDSTTYTLIESGSDNIGNYYIKAKESVDWAGLGMPIMSVTAGVPYTWSVDIMPDKDCTIDYDANAWGDNYSGNDAAYSNSGYTKGVVGQTTLKICANKWSRVYITSSVNADATNPRIGHVFKTRPSTAGETIKFYYRNSQVEQKDHPTPFTATSRTGEVVADSSGYGYDGTQSKSLPYTTDSQVGGQALDLRGTDFTSYIRNANYPKFEKDFTWNVWVKQNNATSPTTTQMVISQGRDYAGGAHCGMNLLIVSGIPEIRYGNYIAATDTSAAVNNNKQLISGVTLDNNWHMLTASVDKEGIGRIYIDGVLKKTQSSGTTCDYGMAQGGLIIGKMSYSYSSTTTYFPFNGLIDDVRLYSTTLSDDDIKQLYQTKARINKNGTMFCNKYIENENDITTNVEKTSILNTQKVSEQLKLYDMETTVLDDGSVWARVFYHNCHEGTVLFTSLSECRNTQTEDKYSRLAFIDEFRGEDGKFEFMLRYPTDTNKYNRWKQLNNPCDEFIPTTSTGEGVAEGYEPIHIDWTGNYWGGLTRQSESTTAYHPCYLSGSVGHGNWFYAIGANGTHGNGIPSYGSTANDVELWIRIDNAFIDRKNICPTSFDDWETGQYAWETGEKQAYNSRIRTRKLIKVSPSTQYYFTTNSDVYRFAIRQYDIDGNFVVSNGGITNTTVLTMNATTHYIGGSLYNSTDDEVDTLSTYTTLFANGSIKPFICLNSETSKTFEMYNKDSQTSIENASFGKKFINVKEIYEI